MKIKERLGAIRDMSIREHATRVDARTDGEYQIINPQGLELFRLWHVSADGVIRYDGLYEGYEVAIAKNILAHKSQQMRKNHGHYITQPFKISDYKAGVPVNTDYHNESLHVPIAAPPPPEMLRPETFTALMNWALDSGLMPKRYKAKLFYDIEPKWHVYLEGNPYLISNREVFTEFIRLYNQSEADLLAACREPSLKPSIKKQAIHKIRAVIDRIKYIAGLSEIKSIWVDKFIDVLFYIFGTFLLAILGYIIYRLTGHKPPWY